MFTYLARKTLALFLCCPVQSSAGRPDRPSSSTWRMVMSASPPDWSWPRSAWSPITWAGFKETEVMRSARGIPGSPGSPRWIICNINDCSTSYWDVKMLTSPRQDPWPDHQHSRSEGLYRVGTGCKLFKTVCFDIWFSIFVLSIVGDVLVLDGLHTELGLDDFDGVDPGLSPPRRDKRGGARPTLWSCWVPSRTSPGRGRSSLQRCLRPPPWWLLSSPQSQRGGQSGPGSQQPPSPLLPGQAWCGWSARPPHVGLSPLLQLPPRSNNFFVASLVSTELISGLIYKV